MRGEAPSAAHHNNGGLSPATDAVILGDADASTRPVTSLCVVKREEEHDDDEKGKVVEKEKEKKEEGKMMIMRRRRK